MTINTENEGVVVLVADEGKCIKNIHDPNVCGTEIDLCPDCDSIDNYIECIEQNLEEMSEDANLFWDNFQNNGSRSDYSYAFVNWNNTKIIPKYIILANSINYMFMNCKNLEDASNIQVVVNSENPSMMGYCMSCTNMEKAPTLIFKNCKFSKTWTSAFAGCSNLKECVIHFGDNTLEETDPVKNRNNMQNTFFGCSALEEIVFTGMGSPKNLDLSECTLLSAESIVSLSEHLYDVSDADKGEYTIKVASTTLDALNDYDTENNTDTISAIEALGWTIEEV